MGTGEATGDLDYLYKALSAATYGLTDRVQHAVSDFFTRQDLSIQHFTFDYFLHSPIPLKHDGDGENPPVLSLAPFLSRIAKGSPVIPEITDGKLRYLPTQEDQIASRRFWVALESTEFSNLLYRTNRAVNSGKSCDALGFPDLDDKTWTPRIRLGDLSAPVPDTSDGQEIPDWSEHTGDTGDLGLQVSARLFSVHPSAGNEHSNLAVLRADLRGSSPRGLVDLLCIYREKAQRYLESPNPRGEMSGRSKLIHYGFLKVRLAPLWAIADEDDSEIPVSTLVLPIASSHLLYGFIWLWLIGGRKGAELDTTKLVEHLLPMLSQRYVPALAVLHQHFIEHYVYKKNFPDEQIAEFQRLANPGQGFLCRGRDPSSPSSPLNQIENTYRVPFLHCRDSSEIIEGTLWDYWERLATIKQNEYSPTWTEDVELPWLFRKYLVASEDMIAAVREACAAAKTLRTGADAKELPSFLIIGDPGSGKDQLARIIQVLSHSFWLGRAYYVNLAALKPDPLAAPSLVGLEQSFQSGKDTTHVAISGVLRAIRRDTMDRIERRIAGKEDALFKKKDDAPSKEENAALEARRRAWFSKAQCWPAIIFDELNSLGIESQGVLLRYLENSEVVPIGGIEDPDDPPVLNGNEQFRAYWNKLKAGKNRCVVIALMNENPDELTREEAIRFVKNSEYLRGLVGDLFYEQMVRLRRLRPDLKYRLMRGGVIPLPSLASRRDDIPILFLFFVTNEVKNLPDFRTDVDVWVSHEAYASLMDERLLWPGNIRELQKVAKLTVRKASMSRENRRLLRELAGTDSRNFVIIARDVGDALNEMLIPFRTTLNPEAHARRTR